MLFIIDVADLIMDQMILDLKLLGFEPDLFFVEALVKGYNNALA